MSNPIITAQIVSEAEVDRSFWKIFVLGAILTILSFFSFFTYNRLFSSAEGSFIFYTLSSSVLFLVFVIQTSLLVKSYSKVALMVFLTTSAALASFYPRIDFILGVGALVYFLFLLFATRRGYTALANSLKIRFFSLARAILPKAVTGLIIFFAVIFFSHYFNPSTGIFNEHLQENFIKQIVNFGEPALRFFLPGFSAEQSTGENLSLFVKKQITSLVPDYERYPAEVKTRIFNETFATFKKNIEETIGPFNAAQPISENFHKYITGYLNNLSSKAKLMAAIIVTFIIFMIIKGVAALFYWLIYFLAFLIFKLILVSGAAFIGSESRSREFVVLT